jgi:hypothetical protein
MAGRMTGFLFLIYDLPLKVPKSKEQNPKQKTQTSQSFGNPKSQPSLGSKVSLLTSRILFLASCLLLLVSCFLLLESRSTPTA